MKLGVIWRLHEQKKLNKMTGGWEFISAPVILHIIDSVNPIVKNSESLVEIKGGIL